MRSAEAALARQSARLFLVPWDLDLLDLETTNSTFHLIEVSFHFFALALVVAVDLAGYDLGVVVYDHVFNPYYSCEV